MKLDPVGDATRHGADVHQVKVVLRVGPILVDVVYLELAVGRDKAGLDRGEIHADDIC